MGTVGTLKQRPTLKRWRSILRIDDEKAGIEAEEAEEVLLCNGVSQALFFKQVLI